MQQNLTVRAYLAVMHEDIRINNPQEFDTLTQSADSYEVIPPTLVQGSEHYFLSKPYCEIGRDPACDIRVSSHRVDISRRHAQIKWEAGRFVISDVSRYGTFVNSQLLNGPYVLQSGDIIGLANSREMLCFIMPSVTSDVAELLTEREQHVLRLVATGRLNKEVASELQIAPNTVNSHLKHIYEKLQVRNRAEAINQARKLGLL